MRAKIMRRQWNDNIFKERKRAANQESHDQRNDI